MKGRDARIEDCSRTVPTRSRRLAGQQTESRKPVARAVEYDNVFYHKHSATTHGIDAWNTSGRLCVAYVVPLFCHIDSGGSLAEVRETTKPVLDPKKPKRGLTLLQRLDKPGYRISQRCFDTIGGRLAAVRGMRRRTAPSGDSQPQ